MHLPNSSLLAHSKLTVDRTRTFEDDGVSPASIVEDGETPANNAGSGKIAGIGVGPNGEPGVRKGPRNKYKEANQLDTTSLLRRPTKSN